MNSTDFLKIVQDGTLAEIETALKADPALVNSNQYWWGTSKNALSTAVVNNDYQVAKLLLKYGATSTGFNDYSDLHFAAQNGNYAIFMLLLGHGLNPFSLDNMQSIEEKFVTLGSCACGKTGDHNHNKEIVLKKEFKKPILHSAVIGENLLIIQKILELGADANNDNELGRTALHEACTLTYEHMYNKPDANSLKSKEELQLEIVKYLVSNPYSKANIDFQTSLDKPLSNIYGEQDYFGCTPLHYAIKKRAPIAVIKILLEHGGDISVSNKSHEYWAPSATHGMKNSIKCSLIEDANKNLDILMLLLTNYLQVVPNINMIHRMTYTGDTAGVMKALSNAKIDITQALLNESHPMFKTPVHFAILKNNILLVQHFIEKYKVKVSYDMLELSIRHNHFMIFKCLEHFYEFLPDDMSKLLLVGITNYDNMKTIRYLVKRCADVKFQNDEPLRLAFNNLNYLLMTYLLDQGADPNTKNTQSETLLFLKYGFSNKSPEKEYRNCVKLLIEKGVDINCKNGEGKTILEKLCENCDWLSSNEYTLLIILLLEMENIPNEFVKKLADKCLEVDKIKKMVFSSNPRCPADEMALERNQNSAWYLPIIKNILCQKHHHHIISI